MRRQHQWSAVAVFSTGLAMSSASMAQTPTTQPSTTQPAASTAGHERPPGTITATGCLQRGSGSGAASDSAGGATSSPSGIAGTGSGAGSSYVLKNARLAGSPDPATNAPTSEAPAGAAGTPASSAGNQRGGGREIRLSPAAGVNLGDHIGHQVSVTGTFSQGSGAESSTPTAAGSPTGQTPAPADAQSPHGAAARENRRGSMANDGRLLTVSSISMVSATCTVGS
jgi:hypothetical protein